MTRLKWKLVPVHLEIVLILTQDGCALFAPNVTKAWKSFWTHPMEFLGDVGHVEAHFGPFRDRAKLDAR
jgi:hypothetical protein